MLKAQWCPYTLDFRFEARTSRAAMRTKDTYFIRIYDTATPGDTVAVGECALFHGLSAEDESDYEAQLAAACADPITALSHPFSSIRFGFESALSTLPANTTPPTVWEQGHAGIPINGLIWMGDKETMAARIAKKIDAGFRVLKLKIGGINFDDEVDLLRDIRRRFGTDTLELRLDANGSFTPDNALRRLDSLAHMGIHSLEQPIAAGQTAAMEHICRNTPIAIALDEELIGTRSDAEQSALISDIRPQYIILKPSLCGGFAAADSYIDIATKHGIGWWATSALESNIGLYAIARWLAHHDLSMPQGLGTGQLYYNNIESPLELRGSALWYNPKAGWQNIDSLPWKG